MKSYAVFGAGNIGFGTIERLATDAKVYVFDMREPNYLSDLMKSNDGVYFIKVNAVDEKSVESAVSLLPQESLDGAILTVGVSSPKDAFEDMDAFRRVINTNYFGNIVPIRVLVRGKKIKDSGKIVVLASTSGHFAGVSANAYAPSKWMLVNACDSMRSELACQGITLDMINPRTIKNVRSDEFRSSDGIEVSTVVDAIVGALGGGISKDYFVPKRYAAFHVVERLSPWVIDALRGLPLHAIRKRGYEEVHGCALITGASTGLGRELTKLLANPCDRIYVTARDLNAMESLRKELADRCEVVPIQVDFGDENAISIVKKAIGDQKIDILINNAGHHVAGSILNVDLTIIKNAIAVNFFTPVALIAAFRNVPIVVNILSTTAIAGRRNLGVYSSTKAGLWCFSKVLRRTEGKNKNVIDVIPATFQSSLAQKGDNSLSANEGKGKRFRSAKYGLKAEDVAKIIKHGIDKRSDVIYIPKIQTRLFLALEVVAPKLFRKVFE